MTDSEAVKRLKAEAQLPRVIVKEKAGRITLFFHKGQWGEEVALDERETVHLFRYCAEAIAHQLLSKRPTAPIKKQLDPEPVTHCRVCSMPLQEVDGRCTNCHCEIEFCDG